MLELEDIQNLEACINTTWGRSSTVENPSRSVTCKLISPERALIKYVSIVNLGNMMQMQAAKERGEEEARQVVNGYISNVKKEFKEKTGKALKMKMDKYDTSIEVISMSAYAPSKTAYLRFSAFVDVG